MPKPRYRVEMVEYIERDAIPSSTPPRDPRVFNHPEYLDSEPVASAA